MMDIKAKKPYEIEHPDDTQIQAMRGTELVIPFHTEDNQSLGVLGRRFYPSFVLSRIELHSDCPYTVGLGAKNLSPNVMIADAHASCHGIHFNTPGTRHYMSSGRQCLINLCDLRDGMSYDMEAGSCNQGRMIIITHQQVASLTERHPDRMESFWRMLEGFNDNRAVDAQHTPLQQNCLNAIFAQPLHGNMDEEVVNDQIATYLSTFSPRPVPRTLHKVSDTATLRSKIHDVKLIIDSSPSTPFTLCQLALSVGTNENYLKAAFYHEYGLSVFSYIFERRMKLASQLLRDTNLSVETISAMVGYPEARNFSTAFRRRFGMTPTGYRMAT